MDNQIQTIDKNLPYDMNSFYENKKKDIALCESPEKLVDMKYKMESISSLLKKRGQPEDRHLAGELARRAERRLAKIFESKKDSGTIPLEKPTIKLIKAINKKFSDTKFEIIMKYLKKEEVYPSMNILQKGSFIVDHKTGRILGFEYVPLKTSGPVIHSGERNDECYTPTPIIEAARKCMNGVIDLDPASNPVANKEIKANTYFTKQDDGLKQDWSKYISVWCNPPFGGKLLYPFALKFLEEANKGFFLGPWRQGSWTHILSKFLCSIALRERQFFWKIENGQKKKMRSPFEGVVIWFKRIPADLVERVFLDEFKIPGEISVSKYMLNFEVGLDTRKLYF